MHSSLPILANDDYGVHVENDIDVRRLAWLVNTIGEEKLRCAVEKIRKKYPETKPFVSVLLKRFRLKVPTRVFAPVNVPIYRVYVLLLNDRSKLKVGFSGNWVRRAFGIIKRPDEVRKIYDLDFSFSVLVGTKASEARKLEKELLGFLKGKEGYQTNPPNDQLCYGAGGRNEWFYGFALKEIEDFLLVGEDRITPSVQRLIDAIDGNVRICDLNIANPS